MNRISPRNHLRGRPSDPGSSTLRRELAEQYPELPGQSVAIALDQATRAAAALLNSPDDTSSASAALVAMLARDRLNAQRERRAAAARRIEGHRRPRRTHSARQEGAAAMSGPVRGDEARTS